MQGLALHAVSAVPACRDAQFLVAVLEIALARRDQPCGRHTPARQRAGAVRGQERPHGDLEFAGTAQILESGDFSAEIRVNQTMLELCFDARQPQCRIEERGVQPMPRNRIDHLAGAGSIRLQRLRSVRLMHESSAHRDQHIFDALEQARGLQCMHAAVRKGEIDGSARSARARAGIRTAVVERHLESAPLQQNRQQRAGRPGADDVDRAFRRAHRRTARASASTATNTS